MFNFMEQYQTINSARKRILPCRNKKLCPISTSGLTLIELMVAVTVFTFIVAIVAGLFVTAVRVQRRILAQQELIDQTSYIMEYMSRALRTAQKELDNPPTCLSQQGLNYELTSSGIKFINDNKECQEFFLDTATKQLKERRGGVENEITSPSLEVVKFSPVIMGASQNDNLQPRVTILLEVRRKGKTPQELTSIRIQTTVSQRNLDIKETK